tara:strand:- start:178 stop:1884 length:1707 start_codon:yes stop_codon:yes gene_type:complete
MIVLGMFGPGANPSSAVIKNGKLLSLIEEERLNRIKTSPDDLPLLSAKKCLEISNLSISDVDYIAWGWDFIKYQRVLNDINKKLLPNNRNYKFNLLNKILYDPILLKEKIEIFFQRYKNKKFPKIIFLNHHLCHAASAVFCSGFNQANILTLDGSGEDLCTVIHEYKNNKIKTLKKFKLPHSLGAFYSTFTEFLGFKPDMDEGKVMGLAAYGTYSEKIQKKLDYFIKFNKQTGDYYINNKLRYSGLHRFGFKFTDEFVRVFGKKREPNVSPLSKKYADLAFNIQKRLEDIVILLAREAYKKNKIKNFCLAGGVAMNCKMNGELYRQRFVDKIFVQPASSDNGVSLGAAQIIFHMKKKKINSRLKHVYFGPEYSNKYILKNIKEAKLKTLQFKNPEKYIAQCLAKKKIVARFQGRMEFGARSLGNRSILASPYYKDIREFVNLKVKHRENWRPFCPSVLDEDFNTIFNENFKSEFMTVALNIKKKFKTIFPACVHEDNTVRVQVVTKKNNYKYWKLLKEFKKLTGYGILINTSFNIQGEPIVCSPKDALRTFHSTGIDLLHIDKYVIKK